MKLTPVDYDPFETPDIGSQLEQAFPGQVKLAKAVMQAESSGNPMAVNRNRNGTTDRGLFQINDVNVPALMKAGIIKNVKDLFDTDTNIRAAKFLHGQSGWQPWNSSRKKWEHAVAPSNQQTPNIKLVPVDYDPFEDEAPAQQGLPQEEAKQATVADKPRTVLDNYPMSDFEKFKVGVGSGLTETWKGIEQLSYKLPAFMTGMNLPENVRQQVNTGLARETDERRAMMEPLKQDSPWAVGGGELLGQAAPAALVPGGLSGGLLARMFTGGLAGGLLGAAQPTGEKDSTLTNAVLGGIMGGAAPLALAPASKVINAVMGKTPKNVIESQSSKYGVRTTLGEATGNPIVKKAESWLEQLPIVGTKGFRQKQQMEAENAAKNHFMQYVIDPTQETTAGMKAVNDAHIDKLYDAVKKQASNLPKAEAPTTATASRELLDRYPDVFNSIQDNKTKRILTDIAGDTKDKTIISKIVDKNSKPYTETVTPKFSVDDLWELRKGVGQAIGDARTDTAKGQLRHLYGAVSDDLDTLLAQGSGKALNTFKQANEAFKQYSVKFDAMRSAYDKASGTTGAGEMFSPKKFSTELKKLANDPNYKKNIKWGQGEIDEMTGLANILQVTKRAGQYAENPPTGNRWGSLLGMVGVGGTGAVAGGVGGLAGAVGGVASTALITKFLTTTTMGKTLARAASRVEPDSIQMKLIMDRIYKGAVTTPYLATRAASNSESGGR
jgi:hypothetical protein